MHYTVAFLEVEFDDMRPADKILDVLGRDGASQLNLPGAKSHIHYLFDSQEVAFLSKFRNEILNSKQSTWTNADTRANPLDYYKHVHGPNLAIRGFGGGVVGVRLLMISWMTYNKYLR